MPVESWLLPVLWRERDWRTALARVLSELSKTPSSADAQRAALELGRASEYIEPDRRQAIAAYELAGPGTDLGRARELAIEAGWWTARARLCVVARVAGPDPRLILDEAEAWWDAGHPDLCTLALAGIRGPDRSPHALDLVALVRGQELALHAAAAEARAASAVGLDAADDLVMAARFAIAGGHAAESTRLLEAALIARPGHGVAASKLLAIALRERDPDAVQRCVRLRLEGLDATAWLDSMRTFALALIASDHHRGFGLRLLRQALERAYAMSHTQIPGHLAIWTTLVAQARADGTRRELLPLAIQAIECSPHAIDHVWLGALCTEISLTDSPVVAGAYAEIVAEHAPDHPILVDLVAKVAATAPDQPGSPLVVPLAAVSAAALVQESAHIEIELDDVYAEASEAAIDPPRVTEVVVAVSKPGPPPPPGRPVPSSLIPKVLTQSVARPMAAPPRPVPSLKLPTLAKPLGALKPPQPSVSSPVLAALRTPDRPLIPPKPEDPADASPRARRIAIPIDVRLQLANGTSVEAHSRDISTSGLFVLTTATLTIGVELAAVLLVPGEEAFTEDEYACRVRVVRSAEGGYGIELVGPEPRLIQALAAL